MNKVFDVDHIIDIDKHNYITNKKKYIYISIFIFIILYMITLGVLLLLYTLKSTNVSKLKTDTAHTGKYLQVDEKGKITHSSVIDTIGITTFETFSDLITYGDGVENQFVNILNFHSPTYGGGTLLRWNATKLKSNADQVTSFDVSRTFPTDWGSTTQLNTWLTPITTTEKGCWDLHSYTHIDPRECGLRPNDASIDAGPILNRIHANYNKVKYPFGAKIYFRSSQPFFRDAQDRCALVIKGVESSDGSGLREGVDVDFGYCEFIRNMDTYDHETGVLHLDCLKSFNIRNLKFQGNTVYSAVDPSAVNTGIILTSLLNGEVSNIEGTGTDWGGSSSFCPGNFIVDVILTNFVCSNLNLGFDFASCQNLIINKCKLTGKAGGGDRAFSMIIDRVYQSSGGHGNFTGITLDNTINITDADGGTAVTGYQNTSNIYINNCYFDDFNYVVDIATGHNIYVENCVVKNGTTAGIRIFSNNNANPNFSSVQTVVLPKYVTISNSEVIENDIGVFLQFYTSMVLTDIQLNNVYCSNTTWDIATTSEFAGCLENFLMVGGHATKIATAMENGSVIQSSYTNNKYQSVLFENVRGLSGYVVPPTLLATDTYYLNSYPYKIHVIAISPASGMTPSVRTYNTKGSSTKTITYGVVPTTEEFNTILYPGDTIAFATDLPDTWEWRLDV